MMLFTNKVIQQLQQLVHYGQVLSPTAVVKGRYFSELINDFKSSNKVYSYFLTHNLTINTIKWSLISAPAYKSSFLF